jgi:hypothetical protein
LLPQVLARFAGCGLRRCDTCAKRWAPHGSPIKRPVRPRANYRLG